MRTHLCALCLVLVGSGTICADPQPTAAAAGDRIVATYRDGAVTIADLEIARRQRGAGATRTPDRQLVEDLVVLRALDARFAARELASSPEYATQREALRKRLATAAFKADLRRRAAPSEAEVAREVARDHDPTPTAERWRISNLFKRFPEGADDRARADLRRRMTTLRERLLAGADFAELARTESDSTTAPRGGDVGFVSLDQLEPAVARAVAGLHEGALSDVIETEDGLSLVRCADHIPARNEDQAERRRRAEGRLLRRAMDELEAAVADPVAEARRRGLLDTPEYRARLDWEELQLRAQLAANVEAERWLVPPTDEDIAAFCTAQKDRLVEPQQSRLEALVTTIDPQLGRSYFERLRKAAEDIAASGGDLAALARSLEPKPEVRNLGWLTDNQVWMLGRAADATIRELQPGEVSDVVQEGTTLYVFKLLERTPRRPLNDMEATDRARAVLSARQRKRAGLELRRAILEEQAIHMVTAPAGAPDDSGADR